METKTYQYPTIRAVASMLTFTCAALINGLTNLASDLLGKICATPTNTEKYPKQRMRAKTANKTHPHPCPVKRITKPKNMTWNITGNLLSAILILNAAYFSQSSIDKVRFPQAAYDLTHDSTIINSPGSAYPIKLSTMLTDRRRIKAKNKQNSKRIRKFKKLLKSIALDIYNLRFSTIRAIARMLTFTCAVLLNGLLRLVSDLLNKVNAPTMNTNKGANKHCPLCAIPIKGKLGYISSLLDGIPLAPFMAILKAAWTIPRRGSTTSTGTVILLFIAAYLILQALSTKNDEPQVKTEETKRTDTCGVIPQFDGAVDSASESENEDRDPVIETNNYGWHRKKMPECKEGVGYYWNINDSPTKFELLRRPAPYGSTPGPEVMETEEPSEYPHWLLYTSDAAAVSPCEVLCG